MFDPTAGVSVRNILRYMGKEGIGNKKTRKRSPVRYWREVNGIVYARLQYKDASGKWKEKLQPITDKRTARAVVEEMRRELFDHGPESLTNDRCDIRRVRSPVPRSAIESTGPCKWSESFGAKVECRLGV